MMSRSTFFKVCDRVRISPNLCCICNTVQRTSTMRRLIRKGQNKYDTLADVVTCEKCYMSEVANPYYFFPSDTNKVCMSTDGLLSVGNVTFDTNSMIPQFPVRSHIGSHVIGSHVESDPKSLVVRRPSTASSTSASASPTASSTASTSESSTASASTISKNSRSYPERKRASTSYSYPDIPKRPVPKLFANRYSHSPKQLKCQPPTTVYEAVYRKHKKLSASAIPFYSCQPYRHPEPHPPNINVSNSDDEDYFNDGCVIPVEQYTIPYMYHAESSDCG